MDPNGSNQTNLTNSPDAADASPNWSPDGTKIAFNSNKDNSDNSEIYVMDANGSNVVRLTNNPAGDYAPVWSPDGARIAFVTDRDGNFEIYVMEADGSNQINLTNNPAADDNFGMCWSPDGGKIAFTSDRSGDTRIYVMDANGSNLIQLTNRPGDDLNPDWSPDGAKIAFTNSLAPNDDIYVMDANGSNQVQLTNGPGTAANFGPSWSPDGAKIAFTSTRDPAGPFGPNFEVYVMDANGSNQIRLTDDPGPDYRPDWGRGASGGPTPTPAPTGTPSSPTPTAPPHTPTPFPTPILPPAGNGKIAFESSRSGMSQANIHVMEADGANPINLTPEPFLDSFAVWSPDGTKMAFSSDRDGNHEIYVMNANGSNPVRLTNNPAVDVDPSWSPDSAKLTFYSDRDGNQEIYIINADGSNQIRLTNTPQSEFDATWSPDGGTIAFTSDRDGNREIYAMNADGSNQTNLTNRPEGTDSNPAWSPDGTRIAFSSGRSGSGIFVMNRDGTNVIRLTVSPPGNVIDGGSAWSPDGTKIAFHRTLGGPGGNAEIFVMNADGSNQTNITNNLALDIRPDWQRVALPPTPTPTATPGATPGPTPSATPTVTPTPTPAAQAINLSTRMRVQTGDNVGIGGFIIMGTAPKHVLLRAIGPSITSVAGVLADPVLELHGPGAFTTIINDNWRDDPVQEAAIIATGIPPTNNLESAIDATLNPGAYTGVVMGNNNTSGVALVEVYDLSQAVPAKLANISTRAFVDTGNNIVIAGFILGGNKGNDRIVARGIGPSLTGFGVSNALANPILELRDSNGAPLRFNDNWQDDPAQAAEIAAAVLAPANNLEAGIAATLPPGLYTTLLAGLNDGIGVGLVEIYDRGAP
jgi:Tol biopolymer transport system component